jgi:hypothetical protein
MKVTDMGPEWLPSAWLVAGASMPCLGSKLEEPDGMKELKKAGKGAEEKALSRTAEKARKELERVGERQEKAGVGAEAG